MRSSLLEDLTGRFRGGSASEPPHESRRERRCADALGDAEWPSQVHSRSVRLRPLTALLSVALVALVGIWGGAELQKRHGSGDGGDRATAGWQPPSRRASATGPERARVQAGSGAGPPAAARPREP